MRKITSHKSFHHHFDKKYHEYLSFNINHKKKQNWFLSRNLFLAIFLLFISIFLFLSGIIFLFIGKSNFIYFAVLLFAIGYSSYRLSLVYFSADAKILIKKDIRKPIVLLHSFQDTNLSIFSYPMLFSIRRDIRLEEAIAPILNQIGPFISVENPTHFIPRLGSTKTFEEDKNWQLSVLNWMKKSRYLVFMINDSLGLEWELNKAIEYNYISKIMIIFPDIETPNYQNRIKFLEKICKQNNISISIPQNLKLLFFNKEKEAIHITSSNFNQEEYEEAINFFIYLKENHININSKNLNF